MHKKWLIFAAIVLLLSGCGSAAADTAGENFSSGIGQTAADPGAECEPQENSGEGVGESAGSDATPAQEEIAVYGTPAYDGEPADAAPGSSEKHYFTFAVQTNSEYDEDGTELLLEYYFEPSFHADDPKIEEWVDSVLGEIDRKFRSDSENLLKYAKEDKSHLGDSFYCYSNYLILGVGRHDSDVISLVSRSSVYSGGANPYSTQTAYNLDMERMEVLTLEDVIDPEQAQTLAELVCTSIQEKFQQMGANALFDDYQETISNSFVQGAMTPYWYFNDQGLVIFYNQYELGPNTSGIIKALLPYASLEGILKEEYFPAQVENAHGGLVLRGEWAGYQRIPITIEDGEKLLIGVEGNIYQVQLSEIYWADQEPILKQMLFSANQLSQLDVLEIIGGFSEEGRSFAIEYSDGQGNLAVYYITPEGLSSEP